MLAHREIAPPITDELRKPQEQGQGGKGLVVRRRRPVVTHLTDDEWRAVKRAAGERSLSDYLRTLVRAALNLSDREIDT